MPLILPSRNVFARLLPQAEFLKAHGLDTLQIAEKFGELSPVVIEPPVLSMGPRVFHIDAYEFAEDLQIKRIVAVRQEVRQIGTSIFVLGCFEGRDETVQVMFDVGNRPLSHIMPPR